MDTGQTYALDCARLIKQYRFQNHHGEIANAKIEAQNL
jgi:hypothetical protein